MCRRIGQVKIAQCLTRGNEASGYLECADEGDEAPCEWSVAVDSLGLMPYLGQCGRVAAWDYDESVMVAATAYFRPRLCSDADWREHDREMGEIGGFREVRVVDIEEGSSRRGKLHKALWVLVVDKHEQESNLRHSYDPVNRDWTEQSDEYTAMPQKSNLTRGRGDDASWKYTGDIVVSMFAGARTGYLNVMRKGAWVKLEEYCTLDLTSKFSTSRKVRRWL